MDVIQLKIAVTGPCRESKGLAFVLAMQSMEGFAAAAMDNAGPKCKRAKPTLVSLYQALAQILSTQVPCSVNDDSMLVFCVGHLLSTGGTEKMTAVIAPADGASA